MGLGLLKLENISVNPTILQHNLCFKESATARITNY